MNAAERIVESYFYHCKNCFTMRDVEIEKGVNRQADLLAYNLRRKEQWHVESSVTHERGWTPTFETLQQMFDKKFLGIPPKRVGKKTDHSRRKKYFENILNTYRNVGFDPDKVQRVFVVWRVNDRQNLKDFLSDYTKKHKINVSVLEFVIEVIPSLQRVISTRNYNDEILRTISLLLQYEKQMKLAVI